MEKLNLKTISFYELNLDRIIKTINRDKQNLRRDYTVNPF